MVLAKELESCTANSFTAPKPAHLQHPWSHWKGDQHTTLHMHLKLTLRVCFWTLMVCFARRPWEQGGPATFCSLCHHGGACRERSDSWVARAGFTPTSRGDESQPNYCRSSEPTGFLCRVGNPLHTIYADVSTFQGRCSQVVHRFFQGHPFVKTVPKIFPVPVGEAVLQTRAFPAGHRLCLPPVLCEPKPVWRQI